MSVARWFLLALLLLAPSDDGCVPNGCRQQHAEAK